MAAVCDGIADCSDGTDETGCKILTEGKFDFVSALKNSKNTQENAQKGNDPRGIQRYLRTLYIVLSLVRRRCTTIVKTATHYKTVAVRLR